MNRLQVEISVGKVLYFVQRILYRVVKGFGLNSQKEESILRINQDKFFRNFQSNFLKVQPLILSLGSLGPRPNRRPAHEGQQVRVEAQEAAAVDAEEGGPLPEHRAQHHDARPQGALALGAQAAQVGRSPNPSLTVIFKNNEIKLITLLQKLKGRPDESQEKVSQLIDDHLFFLETSLDFFRRNNPRSHFDVLSPFYQMIGTPFQPPLIVDFELYEKFQNKMRVLLNIYQEFKVFLEKKEKFNVSGLNLIKQGHPEFSTFINVFIETFI